MVPLALSAGVPPSVTRMVRTRGGSGAARLLPLLDYAAIRRNPKILLGYSDITALLKGTGPSASNSVARS